MHTRVWTLVLLLGASCAEHASCGTIQIPSDVSVSLTAEPNAGLEPGDEVTFLVSVTNLGPETIDGLVVSSSFFHDQLDVGSLTIEACEGGPLGAVVVDYSDGRFDYYVHWYPVLPSSPPLDVGQTIACSFSMRITDTAPLVYPFSFDLGGSLVDLNPSNDSATVVLRRAGGIAVATPVPALSPFALCALAALLAGMAGAVRGHQFATVRRC